MVRHVVDASPINGWVVVDKPLGMTSTQAVGKIKRIFGSRKAGHAGTLDPLATGILPIALGEATKTVPYVQDGIKHYDFTLAWGVETDTCDAEGTSVATSPRRPDPRGISEALGAFVGKIMQVPPVFSAIKVGGERAYALARRGEAFELAPREVDVMQFRLAEASGDHARFSVECGKGTYIRSLARDLGRALATCAHVTALRRTRVDGFALDDVVSFEQLIELGGREAALRPVASVLRKLSRIDVDIDQSADLQKGRMITVSQEGTGREAYAMLGTALVAIGVNEGRTFRPTRVFAS